MSCGRKEFFPDQPLEAGPYPMANQMHPDCSGFPAVGGEVTPEDQAGFVDWMQMKNLSRGGNNPIYDTVGLDKYPDYMNCVDPSVAQASRGLFGSCCGEKTQYGIGGMNPGCGCQNLQGDCLCGVKGVQSNAQGKEGFVDLSPLRSVDLLCVLKWSLILLLGCLVLSMICNNMYDYSVVDLDDYMAQPFQIVSMPADTMSETFAELSEMF